MIWLLYVLLGLLYASATAIITTIDLDDGRPSLHVIRERVFVAVTWPVLLPIAWLLSRTWRRGFLALGRFVVWATGGS